MIVRTAVMVRSAVAGLLLAVAASVYTFQSTAACSGGISFDWAVAHSSGGIVRGLVTSIQTRDDASQDVVLANDQVVRGDPPTSYPVRGYVAMPCDQTADHGETILVIYDVRGGDPPITLPIFYVVAGADALSAKVVADGLLGTVPPTDTVADEASYEYPSTGLPTALVVAIAALLGWLMAVRRTRPH